MPNIYSKFQTDLIKTKIPIVLSGTLKFSIVNKNANGRDQLS